MFPDASECHWGSFVTQVPDAEMDQNLPVEDMTHEPLVFLTGTFKGSQMRWATIDKDGFAIVSTFRRLGHFSWNGVYIFADHRNLAYILTLTRAWRLFCRPWRSVWRVGNVFLASIGTPSVTFWVTVTRGVTCCRVG